MGVIETVPHINIADDYHLMVEQALPEMGFKEPEALGVPTQEAIESAIRPALAGFLIERSSDGANDRLVIAPKIGGRTGIGAANLINRFDMAAYDDGYVWQDLWGSGAHDKSYPKAFKDSAAIHDNGLKNMWEVAVLLGDTKDPASGRETYDPGLVYIGKVICAQVDTIKAERISARELGIDLLSAPIGHLVLDAAGLRVQDQPQRLGVARLVHYPPREVGGYSRVPHVCADGSRLYFGGSRVGRVLSGYGVRRVVRVPVKLES